MVQGTEKSNLFNDYEDESLQFQVWLADYYLCNSY